jgi:16S rRNA A1518/A1519 N6-dimethyltransferase RsmA/KsgA/DIM1 with predicted DNA glycosylase/AP lyase activity
MQWRDREGVEPAAIAALVPLEGKRVIEVGRGTGRLTVRHAASMCAFDPDSEKVAEAHTSLPRPSAQLIESDQHAAAMA